MSNPSIKLHSNQSIKEKIQYINIGLVFLILILFLVGFSALYSAASGSFSPWAGRQALRFVVCFTGMFFIALTDVRWWYRLAWPCYFSGLFLLLLVEIMGHIGMGAQRWINLGFLQIQPSELMKIAVVMALARYFHTATPEDMKRISFLFVPVLIVLMPVALVLLQPDLGTSIMLVLAGSAVFFIAGAPLWMFITGLVLVAVSAPVAWYFLHDYQKQRILTFLNPESDPLGAGYHIMQSKIALGSGGMRGKGFLEGSQSHLNFLPEKQTDFIFTLWVEEHGFLGGAFLLFVFGCVFFYGIRIASHTKHNFGRYLALGLSFNFSLYVFINIAMVMGLIPVVGAPLPLISYGGTAMMAALIGFGLMMSCSIHRDSRLTSRY